MESLVAAISGFLIAVAAWFKQSPKDHTAQLDRIEQSVMLVRSEGVATRAQVNNLTTELHAHTASDEDQFKKITSSLERINVQPSS